MLEFKRENVRSIFLPLVDMIAQTAVLAQLVIICKYSFSLAFHGRLLHGGLEIFLNMNLLTQTKL